MLHTDIKAMVLTPDVDFLESCKNTRAQYMFKICLFCVVRISINLFKEMVSDSKERRRGYSVENISDADYADNLFENIPVQM